MTTASLTFLPWVRQGAAAAVTAEDTLGLAVQRPVATVAAALALNGTPVAAPPVTLRGPADVLGIDVGQVVRTDPRPGTTDFEANCFPSVEFDRPDFPWLFTPAKATAGGRLRPWLCLVVVEDKPGVTVAAGLDGTPATLHVTAPAVPAAELPDLADSWAWAHAQVAADTAGDAATEDEVRTAFGDPRRTLSRLLAPRFLAPETGYIACVVPTFDLGRRAALGLPIGPAELDPDTGELAPAWSLTPPPAEVLLPVLHHWSFRTGPAGDFESLVRRLRTGVPDGVGSRTIDVGDAGFPAAGATTAGLDGALVPIGPDPADPVPPAYKATLAGILTGADGRPVLSPPTYGRWHAGRTVTAGGTTWLEQLNLDPRRRVAAAFGTRVVQEHQEALMASAWEQAAELRAANQRLRQFQVSLAVGESLHRRHFAVLSEEQTLRVTAPAFGRLEQAFSRIPLLALQSQSILPPAANQSAMRRIGRQRGPLSRRVAAKGPEPRSATDTWVAHLNDMVAGPPPSVPPALPPPPDRVPFPQTLSQPEQRLFDTQSSRGVFVVAAENAPVTEPGSPVVDPTRTELPEFFRTAAREHMTGFFPFRRNPPRPQFKIFPVVYPTVIEQTRPSVALPALARTVVATGDDVLAPTPPGVAPMGVEPVMAVPRFPQPMYEALRDLSQEYLVPGLDRVEADTVLGLRTNRPFVESYLAGLNHEMARELLWRGYPTDQRGTYFDHFWGIGDPNTAPPDITDLTTWKTRALGDAAGAPDAERFVLVLRSGLLARYPNASIYLTPALRTDPATLVPDATAANERQPLFAGTLQPDIAFFGFPVSTAAATGADGSPGYYVVIQEHPTEPRFGLDADAAHGGSAYLPAGPGGVPGKNAAELAAATRRLPVRLAIHAARLIAHA